MSITIKTRLHAGIYKSSGGGETRTHLEFSSGPRNLLKAIVALDEQRESTLRGYGNIGCGATWMEIDGVRIHQDDLDDISRNDAEVYREIPSMIKSKTQKAKDLLGWVKAGTYATDKKAQMEAMDRAFDDLYK